MLLLAEHDAEMQRIAAALDLWLPPAEGMPFDQALGLPATWRSSWRRAERDAALIRLRAQHFPQLSGRPAAHAVAAAVRRYETTAWLRDYHSRRRPDGLSGACYDVLTHGDAPGHETLRRLLGGDRQDSDHQAATG